MGKVIHFSGLPEAVRRCPDTIDAWEPSPTLEAARSVELQAVPKWTVDDYKSLAKFQAEHFHPGKAPMRFDCETECEDGA